MNPVSRKAVRRLSACLVLALVAAALCGAPRAEAAKSRAAARTRAHSQPRWWGVFGLELIYDDNIIHYSDTDLHEFETVSVPGKYSIKSADDWIVRPRLELNTVTRSVTGQPLETQLRVSYWRYTRNGIKNNSSMSVRFKHPGFGSDNFQLTWYYSPEAYLRNYRDRPPYAPHSDPMAYTEFRYTSSSLGLAYARTLGSRLEGRYELRRSWRYYNQAFMENDNWEWRSGGSLGLRIAAPLKLTGEYFYSHVVARAADQVGETRDSSNNEDPSYDRDAWRAALEIHPPKAVPLVTVVDLEVQYQLYYFTSERSLDADPTHVGREDRTKQLAFDFTTRPVMGPFAALGGYRWTRRTSNAAGASVGSGVEEEKEFTDHRGWVGMEMSF